MYAQVHSLNMFTNRCKKMIYIKIRPLSELHYTVCLGSGTFTVQLDGSAVGAGHHDWSLKSLTREQGSRSRETRLWERFSQSSSHPFSPNFIRSSHLTPSTLKSLHAAEKKHFLLEKVQFRSVVKIQQQLVEIKFAHFRVIVGELGYILEG